MRFPLLVLFVLFLSLPALAFQAAGEPWYQHPDPPPFGDPDPLNVVLVMIDDIGVDQLASYSTNYPCPGCGVPPAPIPCTPNMDQMAAEGLRFTNAWSSPVCSPTRAQIVTGKRTSAHGVGRATGPLLPRNGLDPDELTLGDLIPLNGYFGKWHLADHMQVPGHPLDCGFFPFSGTMYNLTPLQDGPHFLDWKKYDGLGPWVQTFDYATTDTTDDAIAWIDQLELGTGPWFVSVSYHASHTPYHCPPMPVRANACPMDWHTNCQQTCPYQGTSCQARAMTQALDHDLGRLLASVDRSDTVVILVGDNGTESYATTAPFEISHTKGSLYQGGINVPLIVLAPELAPGVNHELVQAADLFATVLDLTGTPVPTDIVGFDSVSLAQYVSPTHTAPGAAPRIQVFSEIFEPNFIPLNGVHPGEYVAEHHELAIRDHRYKLIEKNSLDAGTTHEFFSLYDPGPGAPPVPHDPAATPDPHEQDDLMLSQASWTPGTQQAYDRLVNLLSAYTRLPLTTSFIVPPVELEEAVEIVSTGTTLTCGDQTVRVGWVPGENGVLTARAFLDFDVSYLPATTKVVSVELNLDLQAGFALAGSQLEVQGLLLPVSVTPCATLYGSGGPASYGTVSGLTGSNVKTVFLNAAAEAKLEQVAANGTGVFSVALVYAEEGSVSDLLTLEPGLASHGLRVTYGLQSP